MRGQVGVHTVGVGLVVAEGDRVEQGHLLLGDRPPAERPNEGVGADLALAEQFGQPAARHVPAEIHLPEAVLRVHVPLGPEEVPGGRGHDLGDAGLVAVHRDVGFEAGQHEFAGESGEGAGHGPHAEPGGQDEKAQDDGQRDEGRPDSAVAFAARCVGSHVTPL